jgi:ribosomal protein L17
MDKELRKLIRAEVAKSLIEANLNETAEDYAMHAKDFCKTVLKLGSSQNVFDRYMRAKKLNENDLDEFMVAVAKDLKNNWLSMYKDQI